MKKQLISALLGTAAGIVMVLLTASFASADSGEDCNPYGPYGPDVCPKELQLFVDKKVRNPQTGVFVNNLGSSDASYSPGSEVVFQLVITNDSDTDYSEVQVTDTLSERLSSGRVADENKDQVFDPGYNSDTRELTFKIRDLKAHEGREVKIVANVVGSASFEADESLFCGEEDKLVNRVKVKKDELEDADQAELCVTTEVLGVTTLPQAGPENVIPYLPFIGTGLTGIALMLKRRPELVEGKRS